MRCVCCQEELDTLNETPHDIMVCCINTSCRRYGEVMLFKNQRYKEQILDPAITEGHA